MTNDKNTFSYTIDETYADSDFNIFDMMAESDAFKEMAQWVDKEERFVTDISILNHWETMSKDNTLHDMINAYPLRDAMKEIGTKYDSLIDSFDSKLKLIFTDSAITNLDITVHSVNADTTLSELLESEPAQSLINIVDSELNVHDNQLNVKPDFWNLLTHKVNSDIGTDFFSENQRAKVLVTFLIFNVIRLTLIILTIKLEGALNPDHSEEIQQQILQELIKLNANTHSDS